MRRWTRELLCVASLMAAASLLAPSPAAAQFHLEDSLRGSTTGNATGGAFGAEGWTITGVSDRIWYALPTLTAGSVEFTVANLTTAALPLADHEIFAMYEDGYGIGEPIPYAPDFRLNHYKILMRIYGMPEPDRVGAMKLMWGICPSGAPGYDACGCDSFFEEPFGSRLEWTGAPVRMRIEWGDGRARLLRDGAEIVSVDYTGFVFGPSDMHMMIGSPRNDGGLSAMPIGATFSDLVVDGTMGSVASCPGMPDAGPLPDAGMCGTAGAATADATAASFTSGVFPDPTDLNVEGDGTAPQAVVYLRFPPVTGAVSRATLTLNTASGGSAGGGSGQVCRVEPGAWDEATLTWGTRPMVGAACSGGARAVAPSSEVSWDVTSLVAAGGDVQLAIVSTDPDGAHYLSREAGGCATGPRLDVEYAPGVDAGAGVDGGSSGIDAAVSPTDDASTGPLDARGAAMDAGSRGIASGCGCRVSGSPWSRTGGLALVAIVALALRRRRR